MRRALPYTVIIIGCLCLFFPLLWLSVDGVGDGSEYYALYLAIRDTFRPWMSPAAFSSYAELFSTGRINGIVPVDVLVNSFPTLTLGGTADFNHFWLYSALAALVASPFSMLGSGLSVHSAFLLLHAILLSIAAMVAYRYYGKTGVATVLIMTLTSPLVWFSNKVHTEFFTYTLGLTAVIFLFSRKYAFSALALAIVSAQNPSFGLVALAVLAVRVFIEYRKPYNFPELCAVVLTVLVALAHPVYYFCRFGVLSPQFLAGGASLGANASSFYIWLVDPDLGLFPNWPLGLVFLLAGLFLIVRHRASTSPVDDSSSFGAMGWWLCLIYLVVGLYANASTLNVNSGATFGVARYALWYVPLLFPFFVVVIRRLNGKKTLRNGSFAPLLVSMVISVMMFNPSRPADSSTPTTLSRFLQKHASRIYDSPAEVFLERFSGYGEGELTHQLFAVIGPDCRKVLLLPDAGREKIFAPGHCMYDPRSLNEVLRKKVSKPFATYVYLSDEETVSLPVRVEMNRFYAVGTEGDGAFVLDTGWSIREPWGVWSDGDRASLRIPCEDTAVPNKTQRVMLRLSGFSVPDRPATGVSIKIGEREVWLGDISSSPKDVEFALPDGACSLGFARIIMDVKNPVSPRSLGLSADPRNLGVGLVGFVLK